MMAFLVSVSHQKTLRVLQQNSVIAQKVKRTQLSCKNHRLILLSAQNFPRLISISCTNLCGIFLVKKFIQKPVWYFQVASSFKAEHLRMTQEWYKKEQLKIDLMRKYKFVLQGVKCSKTLTRLDWNIDKLAC